MYRLLKKHWPLAGIGILIIVVGIYMVSGRGVLFRKSLHTGSISKEGVSLEDIHFIQEDPDDNVKWILDASKAQFSKSGQFITFKDFHMTLEPEDKPAIELKGNRGSFDRSTGAINLYENLQGTTDDGYKMTTEHVFYQQKDGYLKTEVPVKVTGPYFSIEGKGLYFNLERETLVIKDNVTAIITGGALT
ncbi:MAG: LPS export ABC transporter periplasmic protein LptC, partial [Deltaproteobacteria bacterium]|nr:LPS export ABC transporter periplasmic protein LptC [Deltaproteobacteria bacterium]